MTANMPHRHGLCTVLASISVLGIASVGCGEDKLKGPDAEVRRTPSDWKAPEVPAFDLPPPNADGSHAVKELRVKGQKLLESEITVKGFVTWVYDCVSAVRQPGEDDKAVRTRIDEDPTLCDRAKFYLGDSKDTAVEKSAWIVDVPRPYNKKELENLKKKDRTAPDRCEPSEKDPKKTVCPPYAVGDQVEVTGKWALGSPHSERNTDGLLVYKKMKNVTQNWESPPPEPAAAGTPTTPPAGGKPSPEDLVKKSGKRAPG